MKILILGGTGQTGQLLIRQALEIGYFVTALVRNPLKLSISNDRLTVVTHDLFNEDAMTKMITGQYAVLSALGSGRNLHSDIISRAMPVLIKAMQNAGVKKLIFLSSFGVGNTKKLASIFSKLIFALLLNSILDDKGKADRLLKNSDLDYTLVYPTSLTNGSKTGKYKAGELLALPLFPRISRADVADFMLRQITDNQWIRKTVILTG